MFLTVQLTLIHDLLGFRTTYSVSAALEYEYFLRDMQILKKIYSFVDQKCYSNLYVYLSG